MSQTTVTKASSNEQDSMEHEADSERLRRERNHSRDENEEGLKGSGSKSSSETIRLRRFLGKNLRR